MIQTLWLLITMDFYKIENIRYHIQFKTLYHLLRSLRDLVTLEMRVTILLHMYVPQYNGYIKH